MKKLSTLIAIITLFFVLKTSAQTPLFTLDFEDASLPSGVTKADGAISINTSTSTLYDAFATELTFIDVKTGNYSLQMANSGYLKFDETILNKDAFSISFWIKWIDDGVNTGEELKDGVINYAGLIDLYGTVSGSETVIHAVDANNTTTLRVYKNGKVDAGFEDLSKNRVWTYITYTSDASNGKLYANGQLIHSRSHSAEFASMENMQLYLGTKLNETTFEPKLKSENDPARFQGFCGYFDDVQLYNTSLSAEEVLANFEESGALYNSINVFIDDYQQQLVGVGGSTGLYVANYCNMPYEKQVLASEMIAKDINLRWIKHYSRGPVNENLSMYQNVVKFYKNTRDINPNVQMVMCVSNLPDEIEFKDKDGKAISNDYDPSIPGVYDTIAEYYFEIIKWFHDQDVEVTTLDVINEEGYAEKRVDLFGIVIEKLEVILADEDRNPGGAIKRPIIMGPSSWSAASVTKWVNGFKANGTAWDNVDVIATHGYQNGDFNTYSEGHAAADGKPFYNSEQTGKIQDDEGTGINAVDPIARQWVSGEEPEYIGDVSIAMRMTDFINAGGDAFYIFQLNNTKGNNAALIKTKNNGTVEKSQVYDGFKQISSTQPYQSHRVSRELVGLDNFKILTMRKQNEDTVYVHATNLWPNNERVIIKLTDSEGNQLGIKEIKAWVSDEYKDNELVLEETYAQSSNLFLYNATPHSVNSFKIVVDPAGYDNERQIQEISFEAITDKTSTGNDFEISATSNSNLDVVFEVISGPATVNGNTVSLTGATGEVVIKAHQEGNDEWLAAETVFQSFNVDISSSIDNLELSTKIYPNPAKDYLTVESEQDGLLEMFNLFGQKVIEAAVYTGTKNTFYTDELPKGQYVIKITTNNIETHKIIIR